MTPALLAAALLLTWAGRDVVQQAAGAAGLPTAWRVMEIAIVAVPVTAAWFRSPWLALLALVIGGTVYAVGRRQAAVVAGVVTDADVGARDRAARRMLRRDSPPELERMRVPITLSVDLDEMERMGNRQIREGLKAAQDA